ncbi:MAG TPA: hypothetical protein VM661_02350 [Candidatus Sulfotelmatobacter sp.]|jgi:hypothetical protein|nr:hypothetical protein [Candidatus Sulfotelmatobacter sp.]
MNGLPELLFAPVLPWPWLAGLALLGLALCALGRQPWRLLPLAVLLLGLSNPRLSREEAQPLNDTAVVVVDDSPSMALSDRPAQSARALEELTAKLRAQPNLDVRIEHWHAQPGRDDGTLLFQAVDSALSDLPRRRLAGVVMITDGQVRDIPGRNDLGAPLHVLLAGHADERDRRLVVEEAPGFAIVGGKAGVRLRIDDPGHDGTAALTWKLDGGAAQTIAAPLNRSVSVEIPVGHAGSNLLELEAEAAPNELSLQNNRAALSISGVRDRLRVLLISGEPHAGERTWRNLLKADPGVDLVHFTILRPPEKDDRTPLRELALISFPVRELFEEKLHDFDLIIFDRYRRRTVLPPSYYENIAQYVRGGGALLMAVGPEFAGPDTPYATALADVLPLAPSGEIAEQPFRPAITALGRRHPVTSDLSGSDHWGRWARVIGSQSKGRGDIVMQDDKGQPLLVLDRVGEGRVAELMSDTIWLWSRGWDGGGPQAELLRRLAHWLMKEPELEETQLSAEIRDGSLFVQRRSLQPNDQDVTVTAPDGNQRKVSMAGQNDGRFTGKLPLDQPGLWRVSDGTHVALAASGPLNPVEMSELKATPDKLKPLAADSGGSIRWIDDGLPGLRRVSPDAAKSGPGWLGLQSNGQKQVTAVRDSALLPPPLLLLLGFGGLVLAWWREGKSGACPSRAPLKPRSPKEQ